MRHRIFYNRLSKEVCYCAENLYNTLPPTNIPISVVVTDNLQFAELLLRKRGYNVDLLLQYYEEVEGQALQPIDGIIPFEIMEEVEQLCAIPFDPYAQLYYAAWFPETKTCAVPVASTMSVIENKVEQFAFEDEIGVELIKIGLNLQGYDTSNMTIS